MKPILDKLHTDHKNFIKLLNFLEKQLEILKNCGRSDFELTLDAIRYMKEYPDLIHHPLENVVFKYFLEHHKEVYDELTALLHEHEEMPALTERLLEMLQNTLSGVPQERERLCSYLKEYITKQVEHMNREEAQVYPVINSTLTDKEWSEIKSDLENVDDPLFGENIKKSYQALLQKVVG